MWMRRKCSSIALDVGRASVTACQVARSRTGLTLQKWVTLEDPLRERPGGDALGAAPVERTVRLVHQSGFRGREVILALKPPEVSFLTVKVPEALLSSSREQLLACIRGGETDAYDRAVDTHISNLRQKLEPDPKSRRRLKTVWGVGYKFT